MSTILEALTSVVAETEDVAKRTQSGELTMREANDELKQLISDLGLDPEEQAQALMDRIIYYQREKGVPMMGAMLFAGAELDGFRAGVKYVRTNAESLRSLVEGDSQEGETPPSA